MSFKFSASGLIISMIAPSIAIMPKAPKTTARTALKTVVSLVFSVPISHVLQEVKELSNACAAVLSQKRKRSEVHALDFDFLTS